jgi:hypothetical protein
MQKLTGQCWLWGLSLVILATKKTEIGGMAVKGQSEQKVYETPSHPKKRENYS